MFLYLSRVDLLQKSKPDDPERKTQESLEWDITSQSETGGGGERKRAFPGTGVRADSFGVLQK